MKSSRPARIFDDDILEDLYWWSSEDESRIPKRMDEVPSVNAFFKEKWIRDLAMELAEETSKDGEERGFTLCLDSNWKPVVTEKVSGTSTEVRKSSPPGGCISANWHSHPVTEEMKKEHPVEWWSRPSSLDFADSISDGSATSCITSVEIGGDKKFTRCWVTSGGITNMDLLYKIIGGVFSGKEREEFNIMVQDAMKDGHIRMVEIDEMSSP